MSKLRVITWNAEGMFAPFVVEEPVEHRAMQTRRAGPHDALKFVESSEADIVVIPEFGTSGKLDDAIRTALQSLGYEIIEIPYRDRYKAPISMALLVRMPVVNMKVHRLGGLRDTGEVIVSLDDDTKLRVFGIHLDDTTEARRLRQARDLVQEINKDSQIPTIVLGDFNAMHENSRVARVVRSRFAHRVSSYIRHAQLSSIARRLHEMAIGTTIRYIEEHTKLHSLDPGHHHTISGKQSGLEWVPAIRLAKIDWIFGSRSIHVVRYHVYHDVGSDHRPVIADIIF